MGCGGTKIVECFCGGDFCACAVQGIGDCEGCVDCEDSSFTLIFDVALNRRKRSTANRADVI